MNTGVECGTVRKSDESKKLFIRCTACKHDGMHLRLMTLAACSKKAGARDHLECSVCRLMESTVETNKAESKQHYTWVFLCQLHAECGDMKLVIEVKPYVMRGVKRRLGSDAQQPGDNSSYLPYDFCVHTYKGMHIDMLVEIDGEQHVEKSMYGKSVYEQQATDREKDELVLQHGGRLLRIHYNDVGYTNKWINRAVKLCKAHTSFVMYTKSYNCPTRYPIPTL